MKKLNISYTTFAVFSEDIMSPFNEFSDAQYRQGFSWREDSVSFVTEDDGEHTVEVLFGEPLLDDAIRVISVPTPRGNRLVVASIADEFVSNEIVGAQMTFALFENRRIRLFMENKDPVFRVIKPKEIPSEDLIKTAIPAR